MLKIGTTTTAIRIQKCISSTNENGFPEETWSDVIDEDIICEWKNKFGSEVYQAAAINAVEPAAIRLWYIPGITADCRIIRIEDGAIFEIVGNPDDISNRHQQLEIQIKRSIRG